MKIGLFNNMNNNYFSLARYLRDAGHDVTLFCLSEQPQFMPENDTYDPGDLNIVKHLDWYDKGHWKTKPDTIKKTVSPFQFLIGTDMIPAYFYKAGIKLDLMFPHGGDIFSKPFFHWQRHRPLRPQIGTYYEKYCQRQGLKQTHTISQPFLDKTLESYFEKLGLLENRSYETCPIVYEPQYRSQPFYKYLETDPFYKLISEIKSSSDFLVIQHGRQENKNSNDLHYKGNEKLFVAFSKLVKEKKINARLVLVEYGSDVENSKKILADLEVSNFVTWLPKMARKTIMPILSLADAGVGMLAHDSYVSYGALYEYLIMEVPIIHHLETQAAQNQSFLSMYPYTNAYTSEEVLNGLVKIYTDKGKYKSDAKKGLEWFKKNGIAKPLTKIEELLFMKEKLQD